MAAPVRVFVAARGNGFMRDIAGWLVEAAALTGREAVLVDDALPAADGSINLVVAPHEFFELTRAPRAQLQQAAAASVCVCTEQPGTPWFHLSVDVCRRGLHTLDINPQGVAALQAVGVEAQHLQLGAVPSITVAPPGGDRPIDVLFLGGFDDRRAAVLAELAPSLVHRRAELRLFRFDRPATTDSPGVVFGADKYHLLGSATLLVNLHRDRSAHLPAGTTPPAYAEWARLVEAMANGCVVMSEPADSWAPLAAGVHLVETPVEHLAATVAGLLDDPARCARVAEAAFAAVTGPLALVGSLAPHLDQIEREVLPRLGAHVAQSRPARGLWRLGASQQPPPVRLGPFRPYLDVQREAKRLALAEGAALRRLDATACTLRHGTDQHIERIATPAHADAQPAVSVVVSLYDYAAVVADTLDSIVASEGVPFEVIVVEDHATDTSRAVVTRYLDEHPQVPMLLLAKDANEGLAAARNTGFAAARADRVMVMDADNQVYPTCLARLSAALDADPGAAAAYAILEDFGDQRGLRSALAWEPRRLADANYIDAQAMWRLAAWRDLGGYRGDDDHVFGWEDWDLWLRLADRGGHAVLVPQALGRYRVQRGSMIALTNLATDDAIEAMRRRYPRLPWPERG
jgi:hypothetical protein